MFKKFFIAIVFSFLYTTNTIADIDAKERDALVSLYQSTDGSHWADHTNWLSGDPCSNHWHGVQCYGNDQNVWKLDLSFNDLKGEIPYSIDNLTYLALLYLDHNVHITGRIPVTIGNLFWLQELNLHGNELQGALPNSIGLLTNLKYLDLSHNYLESIPDTIVNLTKLEKLYLYDCVISGPIPETIKNLTLLRELLLENNKFSGSIPDMFENMSDLEDLHLQNNQLTGKIPDSIGSLSSLKNLFIGNNKLYGAIPNTIVSLINLGQDSLDLSYNCNLYTDSGLLRVFIDQHSQSYGGYKGILDSNGNCLTIVPVIEYLLN